MELIIGERTYSSWSLRGWILAGMTGAPFSVRKVRLFHEDFESLRAEAAPARSVPLLRFGDGALVWDSLAIAEELADRFPEAGIWPAEPEARAAARSLCAEMHSGFLALRAACPMNLARRYAGFVPSAEVQADVARVETLLDWAGARFGGEGPWLFGARICAADAFFAPVLTRFATYGLGDSPSVARRAEALYAWTPFRQWRAMGAADARRIEASELDLPEGPRFGPAPRPARAVATSEGLRPVNPTCPYSDKPVAADSLAEIDGRVIGFCNRFCRDKSVADAEAWPKLLPLLP